jgi:hypothetical protein
MEKKLREWLRLAHKWGAVMLIDEADVFLERRMHADLKRNSLVSGEPEPLESCLRRQIFVALHCKQLTELPVFLREIEYYQGILFLTTNRVGRFDDAFISRIHVVLHYANLDDEGRKKIWFQFFDKLRSERKNLIRVDESAERYIRENLEKKEWKWNGRQIRNGMNTSLSCSAPIRDPQP